MVTNSKTYIQIDDEIIELKGEELKQFEADRKATREANLLVETELQAKQEARHNAIKKLAGIAGLTDEEIAAII